MQAVALRVDSDRAVFYRVTILGTQDTLLDSTGTHYFYKCNIQGNVDFIFGNAKSLYEDCHIRSTAKSYGAIAAHHRNSPNEDTGFSFLGCEIQGTGTNVLLGRAWGDYARIVYSFCYMDSIIASEGWSEWEQPSRKKYSIL
ncbi:hypothetical protein L6164_029495 [Bauhinia variegata]|uniref:Uncharacterized protein n=1 Tax=Bauhinia variegata TaxID=167791 RepID=A0ACB9L904_BAUVA|nr:hypothetical protein L6164_029495 [Bauhinia variegata]